MSDWLTYTPETFLMFSERTYRRLFEMHNAALWPAQFVALLAGIGILFMALRRDARAHMAIPRILATAWLVVAATWFWVRFSTIHTGGRIMAAAFAFEAIALLWFGVVRRRVESDCPAGVAGWTAFAFLILGVALLPLVGRLLGRPWTHSEIFALAPDPTAIATIGTLLLARRAPWFLWIVPVCWCLFTGFTLWAMHTPDWWLSPLLAIASIALALRRSGRNARAQAKMSRNT